MQKIIAFILILTPSLAFSQINFNEVYNNNGSYSMELRFNNVTNKWDWISLNYLEKQPALGNFTSNHCDLVIGGFDITSSEKAINNALNYVREGECKILIRYDYSKEFHHQRIFCLRFINITTPEKLDYIQNELYKNPNFN